MEDEWIIAGCLLACNKFFGFSGLVDIFFCDKK